MMISVVSMFITILMYLLFYFLSYKKVADSEAISPYECGFEPSSSNRLEFSYRFFLISILFLIFDVEISLMLPIPYIFGNVFGLWLFFIFILVLLLGLSYEYYYGSLDWLN